MIYELFLFHCVIYLIPLALWNIAEFCIHLLPIRIGCGSVWPFGIHSVVTEQILLVPLQRLGLGRMAQIRWPWLREEVWPLLGFTFRFSSLWICPSAWIKNFCLNCYCAVRAHFEFMEKLGVDKWCFHDRDIAPDGKTLTVCPSFTIYLC